MSGRIAQLIPSPGRVGRERAEDFVPHSAEDVESLFVCSLCVRRIVEGPVVSRNLTGKSWTGLIGAAADGDDSVHALPEKFIQTFGPVRCRIDLDFSQHPKRKRVDEAGRFRAGAEHIQEITGHLAENRFGQMAPTGIAGAENEHRWFI